MRLLPTRHRVIVTAMVATLAVVAIAFSANAVLRPGCSLFPVAVPDDASARNRIISSEQACAALGRPLPRAGALPPGVSETIMSVSTGAPGGVPQMVTVGYAKGGRFLGLLEVAKGASIPAGNASEVNATVAGAPAVVAQTRLQAGNVDDVSYLWARDGLILVLHVQLTQDITREAADAMAASIR